VNKIFLPNIDEDSVVPMLSLQRQFPEHCFPMLGLHPCSVDASWEERLQRLESYFSTHQFIAVGEIGIDLYWDKTFVAEQKEAFSTQINWAKERNLPIVIHARDSFPEIYEVLDQTYDERLRGVFHCFTGTVEDVHKISTYPNFYYGIGGVLTYKKSTLVDVLPAIPSEKLLLETDSPYLPPVPFRGKRNESSYLLHTAEKIAEVLSCSLAEIEQLTTENAHRLFGTN
jgi:TatD DNase family protein